MEESKLEREQYVIRCQINIRRQEEKIREAKINLDQGFIELKAKFEKDYEKLKSQYQTECLQLDTEKSYLASAQLALEKTFDL